MTTNYFSKLNERVPVSEMLLRMNVTPTPLPAPKFSQKIGRMVYPLRRNDGTVAWVTIPENN